MIVGAAGCRVRLAAGVNRARPPPLHVAQCRVDRLRSPPAARARPAWGR